MSTRHVTKNPTFWRSTFIAARGCVAVFRKEQKLRIAAAFAAVFVGLSVWVRASYLEILLVLSVWTQVMVGEILNTSLEKAMDYASGKEFHPLIRRGKDYAAASVFVLSIFATFVSLVIVGVNAGIF